MGNGQPGQAPQQQSQQTTPPARTSGEFVTAPAGEGQSAPAAQAIDLVKTYGTGPTEVRALAGIDVTFQRGRFTAVMGPSGSGKPLMHCMAGLDRPTSGRRLVCSAGLTGLDARLSKLRHDRIGFVFQSYNLVPTLTAAENITLPADLAARKATRTGSTTWPPGRKPWESALGWEDHLPTGFLLTTVEKLAGYAQAHSVWPATFGLACCAIELMQTAGPSTTWPGSAWSASPTRRARPT